MPAVTTEEELRSLYLNAAELKDLTGWPDVLVEDYLNIVYNITLIGQKIDINIDNFQVVFSTATAINKLKGSIGQLVKKVKDVEQTTVSPHKLRGVIGRLSKKVNDVEQLSLYSRTSLRDYLYKHGKVGGQTVYGSTETGDDLVFYSNIENDGLINLGDTLYVIESNGDIGVGASASNQTVNGIAITSRALFSSDQLPTKACAAFGDRGNVATKGATTYHARSRESGGGHAIVQADDVLGQLLFLGWDGTDFAQAAAICVEVDATPGNNDMAGRIIFKVSPDGSQTPVDRVVIHQDGQVNIGDGTNQTVIKPDGEITLEGTAKVGREFSISPTDFNLGASGPTSAIHGLFPTYEFSINDDMYASFEISDDWDGSTDIEIAVYWAIDEAYATNSGEVQWYTDWYACAVGEDVTAPGSTGSIDFGDVDIPAAANVLVKTSGTIAAASLSAGDMVGLHGSRVALDGGNNPTAEPYILRIEIEYIANKLGGAT